MTETVAAVLDETGTVINMIVVDPKTVAQYTDAVVKDQNDPATEVRVLSATQQKEGLSIGWQRKSGKFEPPVLPEITTEEEPDLVSRVVEDSRLNNMSNENKAVLEEVLSEKIGRPSTPPEQP